MMKFKMISKNHALVSLCFVAIFMMTPMVSNPGDLSPAGTDSELPIVDGMGLAASTEAFVDSSTSNVDSSPDIGTHSNFANQQAGPDSTYDNLTEANAAPPPTNSEDDIDSDTSNEDSTSDVGIEGTFANATGTALDSSYFAIQEESVISAYGGETSSVFVTGSVPDMAGYVRNGDGFYQAIFWNPTDSVYEVSRVEFSYVGSNWLSGITYGGTDSSPISEWDNNGTAVFWEGASVITIQPHTAYSFYVKGAAAKINLASFLIDIRITANSSIYTESYSSGLNRRDRPIAQLWLGSGSSPTQIHSVEAGTPTIVSISLAEDGGAVSIGSGGTLTIDVPTGFTSITNVGGTNWGTGSINGNQITVSNTATVIGSHITYAFSIISPNTPGLYQLNIAFDDGSDAHPLGNFTIHVTGVPPTVEKVNVEYQWSTATFSETYEEVCIYVASHTGNDNLEVNYWTGFIWTTLGTITGTGWSNFTAAGLSSSTYTIQLIGSSESIDSTKDQWNIDLITLHTWSTQTYNYKLDLEIQWSSVNYSQDNEELCIYAGTLATESVRIDIWTGAVWTNIATDLTENSWNNISIGTWLTSSELTIRFRGDLEVGDTDQSSWEIDCSLLHTWDNEVPTTTTAPSISNLDDISFLYAEYRQYQLTVEVSDLDGYADIEYLDLTLTSNDQGTEYWTIRYDENSNNFTEQSDPNDYIILDTDNSLAVESGNDISATFLFTVNWDHPDIVDTDMRSDVYDVNPSSSSVYYEVNWDFETRLDMSSGPTLDDGTGTSTWGDLDSSIAVTGAITYHNSNLHPSASDIDVWISSSEYGTQVGPWEATDYGDVGGTFSATVYADDEVGMDDYSFTAVIEGAGASGDDLFSTNQIAQYIADQVQVQSYSTDDSRINVNTTASLHVALAYAYNGTLVTDGSVEINGIIATYNVSTSLWDFTDEQSTDQLVTYDTLVYTGGTHGITGEDQNGKSLDQIWDNIRIVSYSAIDSRVNVNSNATIDVTLIYEYDDTPVIDGNVWINGIPATPLGGGIWRFSDNQVSVLAITFDLVTVSDNVHDIALVDQNSQSQEIIWDQVIVTGYSVVDNRVNIDDPVDLNVTLAYQYDDTPVTDGSVTINLISASNSGGGVWQITISKSTVQNVTYNSVACSGNLYSITVVNQNSKSQDIIWDQVIVISYSIVDTRVNVDIGVEINVTLQYQFDNTPVTDGNVWINGIPAMPLAGGIWQITRINSSVVAITYNTITCSGNTQDISSVNQNSQSRTVIWDQIVVRSYTILDNRVTIDSSVNIDVTLEYEYDDSPVLDGNVNINGVNATHIAGGVWRISQSRSSTQTVEYNEVTCSDNFFGITSVFQNGQTTQVTWDQVVVREYSVDDARVQLNTVVTLNFTLEYDSDGTPVIDGTVILNGILASHVSGGVWEISQSRSSVSNFTFNDVQCSGNLHGINRVDQNGQSLEIIWDQITVRFYTVSDDRVNLNDIVNINVTLEYEYDDTPVTDGDVWINGFLANHLVTGIWEISQSRSSVIGVTYDTVTCSGNTFGISSVNQSSLSQLVIWDQIVVRGYEVTDARDNVGDPITITIELEYEYDDSDVTDGSITINTVSFAYTGSLGKWSATRTLFSVGDETYDSVSASGNTYEITDVNQNGLSQVIIWDRILVLTTLVDNGRINTGTSCEIWVTLILEYDSTPLGAGDTVILNGSSMVWDGLESRFELARLQSEVGEWVYFVNSSLETNYGISALNATVQEISVIWDQIIILTTAVDDLRVGVGSSVVLNVTAVLAFDNHPLGSGDTIIMDSSSMSWNAGGWFELSRFKTEVGLWNFQVGSASEATYGITAINLNGMSQDVIWDSLSIYIVADMDSVGNDVQVNFTMTVTYDYDLTECTTYSLKIARNTTHWFTFTNSNVTSLFYDSNSGVAYQYNVTIIDSESTYGITVFTTNTETVVWGAGVTAPVNVAAPVLTNPDDSDTMYARLNFYIITSNVSDAQGYIDIDYIELSLWDDSRSTEIWRIRFTNSTNAFTIEYGSAFIQLGTGCSFTKGGFSIDITWSIKINWTHDDLSNFDFKQYVVDSGSDFDENWYETDYSVETRLDYSIAPSLSDDRGDLDTSDLECTGIIVYFGSSLNPLGNETDVWISHDNSTDTWVNNVDGSGAFTISNIGSLSEVGLNTYTIRVVADGHGPEGIDLYFTGSEIVQFITDRIEFYLSGADYDRVNVGDGGVVWWSARYVYDNATVTGGLLTAQLNGSKTLLWDNGLSRWYFAEASGVVSQIGYRIFSASESFYGLTGWIQTAANVSVIWDLIVVRSYFVVDSRTNVSEVVDIDVLLEYEFDDSYVENGIVQINSTLASYQGSGIWRISETRSDVVSILYNIISCSSNAHNITSVNQNGQFITIIWDRIIVNSYTVVDDRVNINDDVDIDVTLTFEFDGTFVTDGNVTINGFAANPQGLGVWRITQSRSSVQSVSFNSVVCFGNTHGIAVVNQNSQSQDIIWDQIVVQSYTVIDHRINVNDYAIIDFVLHYGYDDSDVTDGSVSINSVSATYQGSGVWRINETRGTVQLVDYDTVVCSGNMFDISSVNQNGQDESIIWDQVVVRSYSVDDDRVNLNTVVTINATLEYAYDGLPVASGTVIIQSVLATHVGNGIWQISMSKPSIQMVTFDTVVCSGNLFDISTVNQNSTTIIWDRIFVQSFSVIDDRVNVDDLVNINVLLVYDYDDTPVLDGSVTINGVPATPMGAGIWNITHSENSVLAVTYDSITCSGNLHGISLVYQNSQSQTVIWDQVFVTGYTVIDSRVGTGTTVNIDVSLEYAYDNTEVTNGSVQINGIDADYQDGGVWRISVVEFAVGSNTYDDVACSGNNYDITSVNQNTQSIDIIWDQVIVQSLTASVERTNIGSTITVYLTIEYEYDNSTVDDGTVFVNSLLFNYNSSSGFWEADIIRGSVTSEDFDSTVVSENDHDISIVNQNGQSLRIIWDQIKILTTTVDLARLNTDSTARIMVTAELEYDHELLGLGDSLNLDGTPMQWDNTNGWFYLDVSQSSVGIWSYYVNTTGAFESTYGISEITVDGQSQDIIWDQLSITITPDAISVDDYDEVSFTLEVVYSFDLTPCTSYVIDISRDGASWLSFTTSNVSLFVDSNVDIAYLYSTFIVVSESTYGITVFSSNDVTVTWTTPANFAPFNNGDPVLVNPDDFDTMYAKLKLYSITSSVVDYDGYDDIDFVELSLWDNDRYFVVWRVRYTPSTDSFSIIDGSDYIDLSFSSSNFSAGALLTVTWVIKIDWDHISLEDVDMRQYVQDASAFSALDWFDSDWDVESRLDYETLPYLSEVRGDVDTSDLSASGKIVYYNSSLSPLSNETDIWVIHDFAGSWSGSADSSGMISVTGIGSSSSVRLNTYTFLVVAAGQGSGGTDLYYSTSPTDTFITDRIVFYQSGVADGRINIYDQGDVWFRARYEYNGSDIRIGLEAYLNGINLLSWDELNNRWHYQEVRASPTEILYQLSSATETITGLTIWDLNTTGQSIIWDSLIISITYPVDRRININENASGIIVSAIHSFDSAPFNGTVVLNNTVFLYSSVQRQFYTVSTVFGDPFGITYISSNDLIWCIWDQIEVVSITTNITYLDPTEYVRVRAELRYDFDDAPVENGNFTLKHVELVHTADGIWEANVTRSAATSIIFDTLTICEGSAFEITSFDMYGNVETVYWDQLEIYEATATDSRIDVGSNGFIIWSIRLQEAGIVITSGIIAEVSDGSALTFIDGGWRSVHTSDSVGDITFSISSASLEGIDFFVSSTNDETIIWDRIRVVTTSATSITPEIETSIHIQVTLIYEYDDTPVTDGVVSLWDEGSQISMTYNASGGFWYANVTKVDVGNYTFYVSATSGNLYGITVVDLDNIIVTVEYIPAILPRLTPMMIATMGGGFSIILLLSAVLVRRRYRVEVPEEIKQINEALKSMEAGEPVEGLYVRSAQEILFLQLEPGLLELGLTVEEIVGVIKPTETEDTTFTADPDAELMDIMDEFKLPGYKQELDEGEIDISILSEEESETAWATMLKEVRRIETEEGRKVPLTKEDWIERIPTEIKSIFFEEELRELDVAELEHLTQLTPSELEEIMSSISQTEDMYASLEPEASAAAISSAISDRIESQPTIELDETEKKERLFELLPAFVKEFFSTSWLEKLSNEEIEELLTIPESELKLVIEHIGESRVDVEEDKVEVVEEVEAEPETEVVEKSKDSTPADLQAELIAELKSELGEEIVSEPEVKAEPEVDVAESVIEYDIPRMTEYVEKFGEEKAKILITIPESMLEGIPEDQIKEMDLKTTIGLKQALEMEIVEDEVSEDTSEVEDIPEPEEEAAEISKDEHEDDGSSNLSDELGLDFEAEPEDETVVESEDEPEEKSDEELSNDLMNELKLEFEAESDDESEE